MLFLTQNVFDFGSKYSLYVPYENANIYSFSYQNLTNFQISRFWLEIYHSNKKQPFWSKNPQHFRFWRKGNPDRQKLLFSGQKLLGINFLIFFIEIWFYAVSSRVNALLYKKKHEYSGQYFTYFRLLQVHHDFYIFSCDKSAQRDTWQKW